MKNDKIIQIIQAVDKVTGLSESGKIFSLEHYQGFHYWVEIVISEGKPVVFSEGSGPSGGYKPPTRN